MKLYKCKYCDKEFEKKASRSNHQRWHKEAGFTFQKKWIQKISETNKGSKNRMWKGEDIGYKGIHSWALRNKPKPKLCEECGLKTPYDLSNKDHKYQRNLADFRWLCRPCHTNYDYKKGLRKGTKMGGKN